MLLTLISDIGNDAISIQLERLAYVYGVMNMMEVYLLVESYMPHDGKQEMLFVSDDNAYEVTRTMLAMAIINHACLMHDEFKIPSINNNALICLRRQHDKERHQKTRDNNIAQVLTLIDKYPNSTPK